MRSEKMPNMFLGENYKKKKTKKKNKKEIKKNMQQKFTGEKKYNSQKSSHRRQNSFKLFVVKDELFSK